MRGGRLARGPNDVGLSSQSRQLERVEDEAGLGEDEVAGRRQQQHQGWTSGVSDPEEDWIGRVQPSV